MKFFNKLIILLIVTGCGYTPIFYTADSDFTISGIKILKENQTTREIERALKPYKNLNQKSKSYTLDITGETKKITVTKDSKGDEKTYRMETTLEIKIYANDEIIKKKKFLESFVYNNETNKFKLKKYENSIKENLINKILENLILEFYTL
jgi:hypothetical protein